MKRMFIGVMAVVLCLSVVDSAQAWGKIKRYKVKSAIVEYEVTGSQTGSETLYFDDFGAREAKYSEYFIKMFGFQSSTENATIVDGEWVYSIDLTERTGTKMNIAKAQSMALKGMQNRMLTDYGEKMLKNMGAVKEGEEKILGKECQIYAFPKMNMKVWVYNRIALKSTVVVAGVSMNIIATSIKENAVIPKDKLEVPSGIAITDISEQMGDMQRSFMNSLGK